MLLVESNCKISSLTDCYFKMYVISEQLNSYLLSSDLVNSIFFGLMWSPKFSSSNLPQMYKWFFIVSTDTKFYDAVINLILLSNTYDMFTGYIRLLILIPSYPSYENPNAHSSDLSNWRIIKYYQVRI